MNKFYRTILFLMMSSFVLPGWIFATQQTILYTENKLSQIEKEHGEKVSQRFIAWKKFVAENQDKSESEKLKLTNDFLMSNYYGLQIRNSGKKRIIGQHLPSS